MDLIAQNIIKTNFIDLNAELMDAFDLYWIKVMGQEKDGSPILPFYHLQSDKFWHLVPVTRWGANTTCCTPNPLN